MLGLVLPLLSSPMVSFMLLFEEQLLLIGSRLCGWKMIEMSPKILSILMSCYHSLINLYNILLQQHVDQDASNI
jgi:hypothetical protein